MSAIHSVKEETKKIVIEREELMRLENKKNKGRDSILENSKVVNKRYDTYVTETKKIYSKDFKDSILEHHDEQMFQDQYVEQNMVKESIHNGEYEATLAELEAEEGEHEYNSSKEQIAAFGDPALLGISEEELDEQCDELFMEPPIIFTPRKNNKMDDMIHHFIEELDVRIPVVPIKDRLYLIGSNRVTCSLKNDNLILRVGGGF